MRMHAVGGMKLAQPNCAVAMLDGHAMDAPCRCFFPRIDPDGDIRAQATAQSSDVDNETRIGEGAALLLTYGTTYYALVDRGGLSAGKTLLVLRAAGGVGLAAIELGKLLDARVVAVVTSDEKAAVAKAAGADQTLVYGSGSFDKGASRKLAAAFKEAVGVESADVIYDPVGGGYMEPAQRSIAWKGRYFVIGFAAGIPRLPMNLPLLKSCDIRGVFWSAFTKRGPAGNRRNLEWILDKWSAGQLRSRIDRIYAFEEGGQAIARLASRSAMGKVVVTIGGRHAC